MEKKTTESTPMPNAEEQKQKTMEISPIDTVEDPMGNTPETIKDESQTKRTSFTERLAMMVGMKSRDIEGALFSKILIGRPVNETIRAERML